jgi:hypothetical protein
MNQSVEAYTSHAILNFDCSLARRNESHPVEQITVNESIGCAPRSVCAYLSVTANHSAWLLFNASAAAQISSLILPLQINSAHTNTHPPLLPAMQTLAYIYNYVHYASAACACMSVVRACVFCV